MKSAKTLWLAAVAFALACGACAQPTPPRTADLKPSDVWKRPPALKAGDEKEASGAYDMALVPLGGARLGETVDFSDGFLGGVTVSGGLLMESRRGLALRSAGRERSGAAAEPGATPQPPAQPNTLTAGSFDDNRDLAPYRKFLREQAERKGPSADFIKQFDGRRAWVTIVDGNGKPIEDAVVTLEADPPVSVKTRADGRAVFLENWDHVIGPVANLTVAVPSVDRPIQTVATLGAPEPLKVAVNSLYDGGRLPDKLDLMFVIDCTGSMQDELSYLKVEVQSIAEAVKKQFPQVGVRFGLVCYRDVKDEYVVRKFDFTSSLEEFAKSLGAQSANNGGDEPEAMEQALAAAGECSWAAADSARVAFLIADAAPHPADMTAGMKAINVLRAKGVGLYPVACSGVSTDCEFFMRTAAISSLGTYLFATDHSGVGNAHAEPHFPHYQVEKLAPLMKRMIAGELSGRVVAPTAEEIIATVDAAKTPATLPAEKNEALP